MADRVMRMADGHIASVEANLHKLTPAELSW
jgi:putative ABC transport system ATP-binding protein